MALTRDELNAALWKAADILRGQIDSSDYKLYLFGFLFLKRLSDASETEARTSQKGLRSSAGRATTSPRQNSEQSDRRAFYVPQMARWTELLRWTHDIGKKLNRISRELERHNPTLHDTLVVIDFDDPRRLGEREQRDHTLKRLIAHFSTLNLRDDNLADRDMLGDAYEYLVEQFADDAGKKGGEFYTPREVAKLLADLLKPTEGMTIYDPAVGSGGMLIECARHIQSAGGDPRNTTFYGQEKNAGAWAICRLNLLLHGLPSVDIRRGDVLRDPRHIDGERLMTFDRVIANPPFSLKDWGADASSPDLFGRFTPEPAPRAKGDFAFLQHMLASTNERGIIGAVLPNGVLFRGGSEERIRRHLLERDLFEAVIGLPANLFFGTTIPACIVILNKAKPAARREKILMINGASPDADRAARRRLHTSASRQITKDFEAFRPTNRSSRILTLEQVRANRHNLNLACYVNTDGARVEIDLKLAAERLLQLQQDRDAAEKQLKNELRALGLI